MAKAYRSARPRGVTIQPRPEKEEEKSVWERAGEALLLSTAQAIPSAGMQVGMTAYRGELQAEAAKAAFLRDVEMSGQKELWRRERTPGDPDWRRRMEREIESKSRTRTLAAQGLTGQGFVSRATGPGGLRGAVPGEGAELPDWVKRQEEVLPRRAAGQTGSPAAPAAAPVAATGATKVLARRAAEQAERAGWQGQETTQAARRPTTTPSSTQVKGVGGWLYGNRVTREFYAAYEVAKSHFDAGRVGDALAEMERQVDIVGPTDKANALYLAGLLAEEANNPEKARGYLIRALNKGALADETDSHARSRLDEIERRQQEQETTPAASRPTTTWTTPPLSGWMGSTTEEFYAAYKVAAGHFDAGRVGDALVEMERQVDIAGSTDKANALYLAGLYAEGANNPEKAREYLNRALKVKEGALSKETSGKARWALGKIERKQQKPATTPAGPGKKIGWGPTKGVDPKTGVRGSLGKKLKRPVADVPEAPPEASPGALVTSAAKAASPRPTTATERYEESREYVDRELARLGYEGGPGVGGTQQARQQAISDGVSHAQLELMQYDAQVAEKIAISNKKAALANYGEWVESRDLAIDLLKQRNSTTFTTLNKSERKRLKNKQIPIRWQKWNEQATKLLRHGTSKESLAKHDPIWGLLESSIDKTKGDVSAGDVRPRNSGGSGASRKVMYVPHDGSKPLSFENLERWRSSTEAKRIKGTADTQGYGKPAAANTYTAKDRAVQVPAGDAKALQKAFQLIRDGKELSPRLTALVAKHAPGRLGADNKGTKWKAPPPVVPRTGKAKTKAELEAAAESKWAKSYNAQNAAEQKSLTRYRTLNDQVGKLHADLAFAKWKSKQKASGEEVQYGSRIFEEGFDAAEIRAAKAEATQISENIAEKNESIAQLKKDLPSRRAASAAAVPGALTQEQKDLKRLSKQSHDVQFRYLLLTKKKYDTDPSEKNLRIWRSTYDQLVSAGKMSRLAKANTKPPSETQHQKTAQEYDAKVQVEMGKIKAEGGE